MRVIVPILKLGNVESFRNRIFSIARARTDVLHNLLHQVGCVSSYQLDTFRRVLVVFRYALD